MSMGNIDRLLGEFEEFKRTQLETNKILLQEVREINQWRWRIDGIKIMISSISGMIGGAIAAAVFKRLVGEL